VAGWERAWADFSLVSGALRRTRHAAGIRLADLGVVVPMERSAEVARWVSDVNHHHELAVQVGADVIRPRWMHPADDYGTLGSRTADATKLGSRSSFSNTP
jgi:hypothetical protein